MQSWTIHLGICAFVAAILDYMKGSKTSYTDAKNVFRARGGDEQVYGKHTPLLTSHPMDRNANSLEQSKYDKRGINCLK